MNLFNFGKNSKAERQTVAPVAPLSPIGGVLGMTVDVGLVVAQRYGKMTSGHGTVCLTSGLTLADILVTRNYSMF